MIFELDQYSKAAMANFALATNAAAFENQFGDRTYMKSFLCMNLGKECNCEVFTLLTLGIRALALNGLSVRSWIKMRE